MTGPLNAWIDTLPSKTLKKIEKNLAPCLFVVGCAVVAGPDIALEIKIRAQHKVSRQAVPRPFGAGPRQTAHPTPGGYTAPTNGTGGDAGTASGWAGSIPTAAPGVGGWDV